MGASDYGLLQAEYARRKRIYGAAVDHLFAVGYQVSDAEYNKLKNSIEEARVQLEIARVKMEEHGLAVRLRAS
jgi:hypothetical protein